ncbi:ABC transporter ATP-binding protein [Fibrella sp. HMF5335]|uniref:ABC transporter ATP-binding protein n=1 Tax=Fibrella rubiginis TaxID=2817060 RepID=A0A939GJU9_9BACT|nr:ABC transporter ATP-binding protein [Fibrella rubiginis]MBO0939148.1 ABC transporter ATP-binding protein [Fibrella rubiginis]
MLTAHNLTRSFDDLTAVRNVTLSLAAGQLVALVGASGSGKSTLLNLLAGLLDADKGTIALNGQPVAGPKDRLVAGHPQIRVVHQEYQLMPNVSIRDNIAYALRYYERAYRDQRVNELLRLCRLEAVQHHKPRETSGGEKQRTAIARAIAEPARVLLLDEPFSHLDLPNRLLIRDVLIDLVRGTDSATNPGSGTACLFVTHDASDALSISDQIGLLQRGRLIQLDTPRRVYSQPKNAYAASLTGPINLIRGKHLPALGLPAVTNGDTEYGIRPEHIQIDPTGPVSGRVEGVFFQGRDTELLVRINRFVCLRVLTSQPDVAVGDEIRLRIVAKNLLTFS